ncbi:MULTISPECIES: hypothetical protein [Nostoc]|uniref:Uncharacterized protein n=2 Tax=Nostoc TaxID=1177 RepID=A0ABR8ICV4_9NOSO|nr:MULTISPECIES: hypothetical protein [Nostoc]MBD2561964.1 hypothetical protein [Nostoc linckia FACHB-391]MBD2648662.1 hypothetical protein [Nostoc foliaceum FACHB-393]
MLVVVASRHDKAAEALVANWAAHGHGVSLLTPEDLSVVGWRHYLSSIDGEAGEENSSSFSSAVVGGVASALDQITGVLTRLPSIFEQELLHIVPEDRAYIATEMNAFLIAWLSSLKCPVLNRPTPTYLLGPAWRPEQWVYAAAQLGIPVRPMRRQSSMSANVCPQVLEKSSVKVTVVGDRCLGEVEKTLASHARRIADAAQVDLLTVHFSSSESPAEFLGADLWIDISAPDVGDAILEYLSGGNAKC